ncbi:MAG: hypothetical protein ACKVU4_11140 [Phycisphaerales bacterium]
MIDPRRIRNNQAIAAGRLAAIVIVIVGMGAEGRAQPDAGSFWHIPPGAIAWFAFDPHALGSDDRDPLAVLVKSGVSGLAFGLIPFESAPLDAARRVWADTRDKPGAVRAALLDLSAVAGAAKRSSRSAIRLDRFAAVIEDASGAATGFGEGAAEMWERERGVRRDQAEPWHRHRARAATNPGGGAPRGRVVLEAYADLNALRARVPDAFDGTAFARTLGAWRLTHARSVMLHVHVVEPGGVTVLAPDREAPVDDYAGPPLLAIELTWESRTEPPGTLHAFSLARAAWPGGAWRIEPRPGAYAVVFRADWITWLSSALGTFQACGSEWDELARSTRIGAWQRRCAPALGRLLDDAGDWVVLDAPVSAEPDDPPSLVVTAPFNPGSDARQVGLDAHTIFNSIHHGVAWQEHEQRWSVAFADPALRVWWTLLDSPPGRAIVVRLEHAAPRK